MIIGPELSATVAASPTIAWLNDHWVSSSELKLSLDDVGLRQGVVAVERLRTYGRKVLATAPHIVRWRRTIDELRIPIDIDELSLVERLSELLRRNDAWLRSVGDCGITLLATPGVVDHAGHLLPTQWTHLNPIDHAGVKRRRESGQPVFITDVHSPPSGCWPRDIKVRCRLHYYLADRKARDHHPEAIGLLVDDDASVTETSIANLAIVRDAAIVSPPSDQVLPGVTQQLVQGLADQLGIPWYHERLWPAEIRQAEEVWLMGTDGGLWFANRVDGGLVGNGQAGMMYQNVLESFDQLVASAVHD